MKQTISLSAIVFALTAAATCTEIKPWQQCGGASMQAKGDVKCTKGYNCVELNQWYSQCRLSALVVEVPPQAAYAQCGGQDFTGGTTCISGYACRALNPYYSQCVPETSAPAYSSPDSTVSSTIVPIPVVPSSSAVVVTSPIVPTTARATSPTSASVIIPSTPAGAGPINPTSCPVNAPPSSAGNVQHGGANIAGFDFGCYTDGTCTPSNAYPPIGGSFPDGVAQMNHFSENGFNTFRLPVGWQYLTSGVVGGDLDATNFGKYDSLIQNCLNRGAFCVIDIHNYARWNGAIIGQGGPSNEQFAALWTSLATHYKDQPKVIFGIMNEPHDVDIQTWAATVQVAVTAIRSTGATSQTILLPGDNYTGAGTFISSGSAQALNAVTNPDGSIDNLVFDVHQYLDSDNSGTNTECVTNNIANAFAPLAQWLRCHGRKAFLTETGGGNTASCAQNLCQELQFLNANSDVYMGFIGWAAGSFSADSYALTMTPHADGSNQQLVTQCFIPNFHP